MAKALLNFMGGPVTADLSADHVVQRIIETGWEHFFLDEADALAGSESENWLSDLIRRSTHTSLHLGTRRPILLPERTLNREGRLRVLSSDMLAFTPYEVRRLLGSALNSKLPATLIEACDGWPFALAMLKRVQTDGTHSLATVVDFCRRSGFQRMIDEEIAVATRGKEAEFLGVMGIASSADPAFLDDVRQASDSAALMERVSQILPFRFTEEDGIIECRSSPLLHHLLRRRFDALGNSARSRLAMRACEAAFIRGRLIHAIDFAHLANQPKRAVEIAEAAGPMRLMMIYGVPPLQQLLRKLPANLLSQSPRLMLLESLLFSKQGLLSEAREMLNALTLEMGGGGELEKYSPTALDALFARTQVAAYCEGGWAEHFQSSALSTLRRDPAYAGWGRLCSGIVEHQLGHLRKAELELQKAQAVFESFGASYQLLYMKLHNAHVQLARGHFSTSLRLFNEVKSQAASRYDFDAGLHAATEVGRIVTLMETRPELVRAEDLSSAMTLLEESEGWFEPYACGYIYQARIAYARGGVDEVLALTESAEQFLSQHAVTHIRGILAALRAYYALLANKTDVQLYIDRLALLPPETSSFWRERHLRSMIASMQAERANDVGLAIRLMDASIEQMSRDGLRPAMLDASLHRIALLERHRVQKTLRKRHLASALTLAHDLRAVGLLDKWREVVECYNDDSDNVLPPPVRDFLTFVQLRWGSKRVSPQALTDKEQIVLDNLARDLSNKELGRLLKVSANTIKFHLKHIYHKLGVDDRDSAVRVGRMTGMIR